jgi:hypothetical protein
VAGFQFSAATMGRQTCTGYIFIIKIFLYTKPLSYKKDLGWLLIIREMAGNKNKNGLIEKDGWQS